MKKVIITSSGIKITIESNPENSNKNFDYISNTISDYFECIEEPEYINQDVLFETKLIEQKNSSLFSDKSKHVINKNLMN
ncbi:hypothetical protein [Aquimarina sp. AU119]|uniref:hypothetical protein n=1 Tax=Aquimarina sp. AU119 TaxID=2108528 RepID=UPI000D69F359|nr:hypothetical protein [Aquimarina sp. AU119]